APPTFRAPARFVSRAPPTFRAPCCRVPRADQPALAREHPVHRAKPALLSAECRAAPSTFAHWTPPRAVVRPASVRSSPAPRFGPLASALGSRAELIDRLTIVRSAPARQDAAS